jgi:signal transduction histidine kinase
VAAGPCTRSGGYHDAHDLRLLNRGIVTAVLVLCFGVVISVNAYFTVQRLYQAEAQKEFQAPAAQVTGAVSLSLGRYLDVVKSLGAFFAASDEVDRWVFFEFARDTLPRYPGVETLSWVPRVPAEARAAFELRAREDGLFGFRFRDSGAPARQDTPAAREEHFPLYYVEPFEGNEETLGIDLAGDAGDLEVLQGARDSGGLAIDRATPGSDRGGGTDLVVVLPVYRSGEVPEALEERDAELLGFARAVISLPKLIDAALPGPPVPPGLDIYIYDEAAEPGARLVAYRPSPLRGTATAPLSEAEVQEGLFAATRHEIDGRDWSIVVKPVDSYLQANLQIAAWSVFAIGILLTLLLVQYLISSHLRTRVIERAVTKRTAELHAAKQRAEVASRAKSDFLAMMSHELRTPLNAVIGFSEILKSEALGPLGNEQYRGYAEDIRSSGTELLTRINDILELTKIDNDGFTLMEEPLVLAKAYQAVEPIIREKASAGELDLVAQFPPDLPQLFADSRAVKQILLNLLSNAVKFTPAGGTVKVDAGVDAQGRVYLRVSDSGIGIDPDHLAQVLQPFSQADSRLDRKYEGTGLGLTLTQRFLALHGGTLDFESEPGAGTTVVVTFPKERVLAETAASEVA